MAIERSVSLRLPNERPRIPVVKRDRNQNIHTQLDLESVGEAPASSASAPTLNLAYFGPGVHRPPSLHHSRLDLSIENISTTLERGTLRHRQSVDLPARYRRNLLSSSLRSIFSAYGDKSKKMPFNQPGLRMHLPPPIEEGVVFSDDVKDREDDANTAIKWLHQEILQMKKQDRALMRRLLGLRTCILQLSEGSQSSDHHLSSSMTTLSSPTYHPLSADSWPRLGNPETPRSCHEEAKDLVQDFHHRDRAVSIVAVMPAGRAAKELAERVKFQENHGREVDQESDLDRSATDLEDSGQSSDYAES